MVDDGAVLLQIHGNRSHLLGVKVNTGDFVHKHLLLHLDLVTGLVKLGTARFNLESTRIGGGGTKVTNNN